MNFMKIEKRSKKATGRMSRRKGHSFEREIASRLRVVFPDARRQLEYHADDARGVDIQGTGAFKIQCKRGRSYASINKINEVQCERALGDVPILVTQGDFTEPMVALYFEDFLLLLKRNL